MPDCKAAALFIAPSALLAGRLHEAAGRFIGDWRVVVGVVANPAGSGNWLVGA